MATNSTLKQAITGLYQHNESSVMNSGRGDDGHLNVKIAVVFMLSVFSVVGVIGNAIAFYIFFGRRSMSTSVFFILTLAGTDFFTCLVTIPYTIVFEILKYNLVYDMACKTYMFLITSTVPFSAYIMVAIALDRYFCICHPFLYVFTVPRAKSVVLCMGIPAAILGLITALSHGTYAYRSDIQLNSSNNIFEHYTSMSKVERSDLDRYLAVKNLTYVNIRVNVVPYGQCVNNTFILSHEFLEIYEKIHALNFLLAYLSVAVLYILIYKSIFARRVNKAKRRKSNLYPTSSNKAKGSQREETQMTASMSGNVNSPKALNNQTRREGKCTRKITLTARNDPSAFGKSDVPQRLCASSETRNDDTPYDLARTYDRCGLATNGVSCSDLINRKSLVTESDQDNTNSIYTGPQAAKDNGVYIGPQIGKDENSECIGPDIDKEHNGVYIGPHSDKEHNGVYIGPHSDKEDNGVFIGPHSDKEYNGVYTGPQIGHDNIIFSARYTKEVESSLSIDTKPKNDENSVNRRSIINKADHIDICSDQLECSNKSGDYIGAHSCKMSREVYIALQQKNKVPIFRKDADKWEDESGVYIGPQSFTESMRVLTSPQSRKEDRSVNIGSQISSDSIVDNGLHTYDQDNDVYTGPKVSKENISYVGIQDRCLFPVKFDTDDIEHKVVPIVVSDNVVNGPTQNQNLSNNSDTTRRQKSVDRDRNDDENTSAFCADNAVPEEKPLLPRQPQLLKVSQDDASPIAINWTLPRTAETSLSADNSEQNRAVEKTALNSQTNSITKKRAYTLKDRHLMANIKTAFMLFIVTLVFIIAFLPALLMANDLVPLNLIAFYSYFIYNVINPFIYAFMNQTFREDLTKLIKVCHR